VTLAAPESNIFAAFCNCMMQVEAYAIKQREVLKVGYYRRKIYLHTCPNHVTVIQGKWPAIITL
jgi:hypothetical protein